MRVHMNATLMSSISILSSTSPMLLYWSAYLMKNVSDVSVKSHRVVVPH